jgi:hypothetical protein
MKRRRRLSTGENGQRAPNNGFQKEIEEKLLASSGGEEVAIR